MGRARPASTCATLAAAAALVPSFGCQLVFPTVAEADAGNGPPGCAPVDGGYHDLTRKECWETYTVPATLDYTPDYSGGSFDGRYLYFADYNKGLILRYDTRSPFAADGSWSTHEEPSDGFSGVTFDGRYMYFVPGRAPSANAAVFYRYDTTADFATSSSWQSFALPAADPILYQGATFDGRYLYFAAYEESAAGRYSGKVERYDTHSDFTATGSWSSFDTRTIPGALKGQAGSYQGAVFDGRWVYFVPDGYLSNVVARHDTTKDFASASSWEVFDTGAVNSKLLGFSAGMFDGNNVYLVPFYEGEAALQYDVAKPFTALSSWKEHAPAPGMTVNLSNGTPTFFTGAFDGRSLYYVPGPGIGGTPNGLLVRHDGASAGFPGAAWTSFDTHVLHAASFGAAVFDGQYLYLAPFDSITFARFYAKDTPSQPQLPGYFGSFY